MKPRMKTEPITIDLDSAAIGRAVGNEMVRSGRLDRMLAEPLTRALRAAKGLTRVDGSTGGFLVASSTVQELLDAGAAEAIVRPRATLVPLAGGDTILPFLDQGGDPALLAGFTPAWSTPEATALTDDQPAYGALILRPKALSGTLTVANSWLDDVPAAETALRRLFARAVAYLEDRAALVGNGVAQPLGVLASPAAIAVTRGTAAAALELADVGAMVGKLHPAAHAGAVWVLSSTALAAWVATGEKPLGELFPRPDGSPRPVLVSPHLATAGSAGDVLLADFSFYALGQRGELEVAESRHVRMLTGQTVFRLTWRCDGAPWLDGAVTLPNNDVVSPFVYLS